MRNIFSDEWPFLCLEAESAARVKMRLLVSRLKQSRSFIIIFIINIVIFVIIVIIIIVNIIIMKLVPVSSLKQTLSFISSISLVISINIITTVVVIIGQSEAIIIMIILNGQCDAFQAVYQDLPLDLER